MKCPFCKPQPGEYREVCRTKKDRRGTTNAYQLDRFNIRSIGQQDWVVMACEKCGNLQHFREDLIV